VILSAINIHEKLLIKYMGDKKRSQTSDPDLGTYNKKATGRELNLHEEISIRLDTLMELLHEKGIINKKELESRVAMHLHEFSKATAFEEIDEEL
jgi:glutamine synthetase type III